MADEKQPTVSRVQTGKERAAADAKTARLKALRLAREAEEGQPPPRPAKRKKTSR
jgi:hypothetical protein